MTLPPSWRAEDHTPSPFGHTRAERERYVNYLLGRLSVDCPVGRAFVYQTPDTVSVAVRRNLGFEVFHISADGIEAIEDVEGHAPIGWVTVDADLHIRWVP